MPKISTKKSDKVLQQTKKRQFFCLAINFKENTTILEPNFTKSEPKTMVSKEKTLSLQESER